ncbi:MAG: hypothetical protein FJZ60_02165, partial [Chlamydiae bacterium]|nr:hypothetical protein [Chlamydiota bacterium]
MPHSSHKACLSMSSIRRRKDPLVDDNNLLDPYKDFIPGSCIVAINNLPVQKDKPFEAHLEGAYGANVSFALKDLEGKVESQLVMPLTLSNCKDLGLYDWSYKNRLKVDEESKGQIGYIHLPSMDLCDYFVFTKLFSALSDKRGIILDLRYNYGGWIHNHVMDKIGKPNGVYNKLHGVDSCFEPADCHPKI